MYGDAWDDMSHEYDNSVENNTDYVISGFLSEEIRIASSLCKKVIKPDSKYTIIDMGSGTGRVLFALRSILGHDGNNSLNGQSVSFCGLDASEPMIRLSKKKQSDLKAENISFLNRDVTDSAIDKLFDADSTKIVLCMYNTVGVIPATKRQQFFDSMVRLAGKEGLVMVSAFNGDDFAFVAPKIYLPMRNMVKQIDEDSFDETQLAFKNKLGYYSQWFTKEQLLELLCSDVGPTPINLSFNGAIRAFGHIFLNRSI